MEGPGKEYIWEREIRRDGSICDHVAPRRTHSTSFCCEIGVIAQDAEGDRGVRVCVCVVASQVPPSGSWLNYSATINSLHIHFWWFLLCSPSPLSSSTPDCFSSFVCSPSSSLLHLYPSLLCSLISSLLASHFHRPPFHLVPNLSPAALVLSLLFFLGVLWSSSWVIMEVVRL